MFNSKNVETPVEQVYINKSISEGFQLVKIVDYSIKESNKSNKKQVILHLEGKPNANITEPFTHNGVLFPDLPSAGQTCSAKFGVYVDFSIESECIHFATNMKLIAKALNVEESFSNIEAESIEDYLAKTIKLFKDAGFVYLKLTCEEYLRAGKSNGKALSIGNFVKKQPDNSYIGYTLVIPEKDFKSIETVGTKTTLKYTVNTDVISKVFDLSNERDYKPLVKADSDDITNISDDLEDAALLDSLNSGDEVAF